ncbi:MAG: beta-galactosidase [Lentisphaeria bacterium]|jgi:thiol-disulfide isomerase/thioredoxin|nr:beta-galactosidase [Lentisphaeria bacterium]
MLLLYRRGFLAATLFFTLLFAVQAAAGKADPASIEDIEGHIARLQARIDKARVDTRPEALSLQVAQQFIEHISWDSANRQDLAKALAASHLSDAQAAAQAAALPERQGRQVIGLLEDALERLDALARRQGLRRTPGPVDWQELTIREHTFRSGDRIVFPGGFGEIADADDLGAVAALGSAFAAGWAAPDGVIKTDGDVNSRTIGQIRKHFERTRAVGMQSELTLSHLTRTGVGRRYGGIRDVKYGAVQYDIDHPDVRRMWKRVIETVAPKAAEAGKFFAWRLVERPAFPAGAKVSAHTIAKYRGWLQARHAGIAALNGHWGTKHASFDVIAAPGKKSAAGEWHDWCAFNRWRVDQWLAMLQDLGRTYLESAVAYPMLGEIVGLPVAGERPRDGHAASGIDLESIATAFPVVAFSAPTPALPDGPWVFDWRASALTFGLMRSIAPDTLLLATDWQGLGVGEQRHPELAAGHIRCALWMLHLHGAGGSQAAGWLRAESKPVKAAAEDFHASILTQPRMLDEYARTVYEVNAWASIIDSVARAPSAIHLLYSPPAAAQSGDHMLALLETYESLVALGGGVSFISESMLETGVPESCRWLVVPAVDWIGETALEQLRGFVANGGHVSLVGDCLAHDLHGRAHDAAAVAWVADLHRLAPGTAAALFPALAARAAELRTRPPLSCITADGKSLAGLVWRQIPWNGGILAAITNPRRQAVPVAFKLGDRLLGSSYDLIDGGRRDMRKFRLEPYAVHLLYFGSEENRKTAAESLARSNPGRVVVRALRRQQQQAAAAEAAKAVAGLLQPTSSMDFDPPRKLVTLGCRYAFLSSQKRDLDNRRRRGDDSGRTRRLQEYYSEQNYGLSTVVKYEAEKHISRMRGRLKAAARRVARLENSDNPEPGELAAAQSEKQRQELLYDAFRGDLNPAVGAARNSVHSLKSRNTPKLTGRTLGGEVYSTSAKLGKKYIVVTFWSSKSPASVAATRALARVSRKLDGEKVDVVAINIGDDRRRILDAFETLPENVILLQALRPEKKPNAKKEPKTMIDTCKLKILPTSLVIDNSGTTKLVLVGNERDNPKRLVKRVELLIYDDETADN